MDDLASLREAAGLTQSAAASAIGYSAPHLCRVEKGKARPSWGILVRLAELYGHPVEDVARVVGRNPQNYEPRKPPRP